MQVSVAHQMQPPAVWLNEDESRGLVIAGAVIMSRSIINDDSSKEVLVDAESHVRMLYTTVKVGNHWKIHSMDCVYLKDSLTPGLPGQQIVIEPKSVSSHNLPDQSVSKV